MSFIFYPIGTQPIRSIEKRGTCGCYSQRQGRSLEFWSVKRNCSPNKGMDKKIWHCIQSLHYILYRQMGELGVILIKLRQI